MTKPAKTESASPSWTELQFRDFVTLQRGFDLPKARIVEGDVPVLGSNCVIGYHNETKVGAPGVVTGRSGTLGLVQYSDQPFWPHNTALWVKDFKGNNPKFVYYKLQTLHLERFNGGASVPTLNRNVLDTLPVRVPKQTEQTRIASILSTYDDLIENNRRRIQLLEQAARLLYKEWFVWLRFPGHEHVKVKDGVPEGWERKPLGELAPLNYGKALKKDHRIPGPFPVFGSSGVVGTHEKALVPGPAIIVGRKGNAGSVHWSKADFYPIDTVYFIEAKHCSIYLYYALIHTQFINTDVAVPGLNRDFAHSRLLLLPDNQILALFEQHATAIYEQMNRLEKYSQELAKARDLLLPRLMSGEIAV